MLIVRGSQHGLLERILVHKSAPVDDGVGELTTRSGSTTTCRDAILALAVVPRDVVNG